LAAAASAPTFTVPIGLSGWVAGFEWTGAAYAPLATLSTIDALTPNKAFLNAFLIVSSLAIDESRNHSGSFADPRLVTPKIM
jgi:hypothetical protein